MEDKVGNTLGEIKGHMARQVRNTVDENWETQGRITKWHKAETMWKIQGNKLGGAVGHKVENHMLDKVGETAGETEGDKLGDRWGTK